MYTYIVYYYSLIFQNKKGDLQKVSHQFGADEPDLHSKELQDAYGCTYPEEIVEKLFDAGEITPIAMECMKLAGYIDSVKLVEEVKN